MQVKLENGTYIFNLKHEDTKKLPDNSEFKLRACNAGALLQESMKVILGMCVEMSKNVSNLQPCSQDKQSMTVVSTAAVMVDHPGMKTRSQFMTTFKRSHAASVEDFVGRGFSIKWEGGEEAVEVSILDGNHRWDQKQYTLDTKPDEFHDKAFWFLTPAQIFIGLSPEQAR